MGKKTNEARKALFEELRGNGKLQRPVIKPKPRETTKRKVVEIKEDSCYCRSRFDNSLPLSFRPCPDCPVDNGTEGE